jgi:hypothetical protein
MQELKEKAFGGDISVIKVAEIDTFFINNKYNMSNSGMSSFLKALKIPVNYFLRQPEATQEELLINQKNSTDDTKTLSILSRNGIIEFVSTVSEEQFLELNERTPMNQNNTWIFLEENLSAGYVRYFYPTGTYELDEYNLGVFIDFPILYSKPMILNTGFIRPDSGDSTLNLEVIIPNTKIKLKNELLPETTHDSYLLDLIEAIKNTSLDKTIVNIQNINTDADSCIQLLLSFEKDKLINKSISRKIRKYIDKEDKVITNLKELLEVMGSFSNYLTSYSSKVKFKTDVCYCLLSKHNKLPVISYIVDFTEGY